jgi:lipopolysaccharide heptosyltransferase II
VSFSGAKLMDRVGGGVVHRLLRPWRALRPAGKPLETIREIAVVKFWGVGNAALLLPILRSLKRRYPGARLTVVTLQGNEAVYAEAADRVLSVRARRMTHALIDLGRITRRLRRDRVDLAIDMEQFVRTSQVLLFLAAARQVIAFDTPGLHRAALANVRVPYDDHKHMAEGFLDLARAAGVPDTRYRPGGLQARVDSPLVADERPLAVLHPGSGDNFPGRRWPTRRFGLLARNLVDAGARVALTGSADERELAREVAEAAGVEVEDLSGQLDLDRLVALLAGARVLVSNDTGPVHLAGGVGTPVVALYGPNTPRLYGPLAPNSRAFYRPPPCSPCMTNFNYKTSGCLNPVCIRALEVDEVAAAVRARLHAVSAEKRA